MEFKFSEGADTYPGAFCDLFWLQSERITKGAGTVWQIVQGDFNGASASPLGESSHTVEYTGFYAVAQS